MNIIKHVNGSNTIFTTDVISEYSENGVVFTASPSTEAEALKFLCGQPNSATFNLKDIDGVIHLTKV